MIIYGIKYVHIKIYHMPFIMKYHARQKNSLGTNLLFNKGGRGRDKGYAHTL